jgi:hypothetical protein
VSEVLDLGLIGQSLNGLAALSFTIVYLPKTKKAQPVLPEYSTRGNKGGN